MNEEKGSDDLSWTVGRQRGEFESMQGVIDKCIYGGMHGEREGMSLSGIFIVAITLWNS